jgi:hypothetical protein
MKLRSTRVALASAALAAAATTAFATSAHASSPTPPAGPAAGVSVASEQAIGPATCNGDVCFQAFQSTASVPGLGAIPNIGTIDVEVWVRSSVKSGHFELQVPDDNGGTYVLNSNERTNIGAGTGAWFRNLTNANEQFTATAWQDNGRPGQPVWVNLGSVSDYGPYI